MKELPQGWVETVFSEIFDHFQYGLTAKADSAAPGTRFLRITDIHNGMVSWDSVPGLVGEHDLGRYLLADGDFVFARSGSIEKAARLVNPPNAVFASYLIRARPMMPQIGDYLAYFVRSDRYLAQIADRAAGIGMSNVNAAKLGTISISVPPLPEQQRIVAKINSLTDKSRRARSHLEQISRLVKKYKEAVLSAAFRGELIGLKTEESIQLHRDCWDLPVTWRWVLFGDVVNIASNLKKAEEISELPHIAPDSIESGTGRLLPYRSVREDGVISPKHKFYKGQLLYSKIRPYLRKAAFVSFDGACSADMYPLTPSHNINAIYLLYWLVSESFSYFTFEHQGRSVLPKINQKGLKKTPLPLPPISDQLAIVHRIQSAFAWVDNIAANATSARKLVEQLDQAVLAKAFRGELVPQDPNDEPASILLERIRAERAASPQPKRGRRKKA